MEENEELKQEATDIAGLVEYQSGSIVSRTLIDKDAGTVTLFAFDEGQGLSEHTAPFDAMVHILDGEVEISISGQLHMLKEGEMIIMPANEPHALKATSKFKMVGAHDGEVVEVLGCFDTGRLTLKRTERHCSRYTAR
jgi:quercetin dioxygenase-like cupin family protein